MLQSIIIREIIKKAGPRIKKIYPADTGVFFYGTFFGFGLNAAPDEKNQPEDKRPHTVADFEYY